LILKELWEFSFFLKKKKKNWGIFCGLGETKAPPSILSIMPLQVAINLGFLFFILIKTIINLRIG
jgi:hypothetical protein